MPLHGRVGAILTEGAPDGAGLLVGKPVGILDGMTEGLFVGPYVGCPEGMSLGWVDGAAVTWPKAGGREIGTLPVAGAEVPWSVLSPDVVGVFVFPYAGA